MTLAPERPTRFVMNYVPRPRYADQLTLAALLTAVGCARLLVRYDLAVWGIAREYAETAELLVSELATNAVKTTGLIEPHQAYSDVYDDIKLIDVRLRLIEHKLVIEVWDSSQGSPTPKRPDFDAESGRGLLIVQSLSSRWGYYLAPQGGKVVWCELTVMSSGMGGGMEAPGSLPRRVRQKFHQPDNPIEPMRDPHILQHLLEGLQHLGNGQERQQ